MWVQLLAGPPALESLVKVSSKIGAPSPGEYSEAIEPVLVLFYFFSACVATVIAKRLVVSSC